MEGAAEGLCVVAAEQTAGRGRLDRRWISPKDAGLYFSILLHPQMAQKEWPLLTLLAGVAVHDALLDSCALATDIKWPNDILANDRKLCGILAETLETPSGRAVVIGIGINLTKKSFSEELAEVATSIEGETGVAPSLEKVLEALVQNFSRYYEQIKRPSGDDEILARWSACSSYTMGKLVQVTENKETFLGTTRGLEGDGALRVETNTGEIRLVRAADVMSVRPTESAKPRTT